jgi:hypothetical protein
MILLLYEHYVGQCPLSAEVYLIYTAFQVLAYTPVFG